MLACSPVSAPLVAIVGAPNVGKSTLFNRLIRARRSIVTDEPGVTRDRIYGEVETPDGSFRLVDTGGLTPEMQAPFSDGIDRQASQALDEAEAILFVVDVRSGISALEQSLATRLRKLDKPLLLLANKVDGPKQEAQAAALAELGLGQPIAISAEHGLGVAEMVERIMELLGSKLVLAEEVEAEPFDPDAVSDALPEGPIRVAIVGRPNVGKSSILNRLAGEERALVSDIPGTTRDAIDTELRARGRTYRLIDTAGIRRRGKVQLVVERFSVQRARKNIERCDVALLVLDASQELAAQDLHVAGYVRDAYKPMVVLVNKWDLLTEREEQAKEWEERIRYRMRFAKGVPLIFVSAESGQRVRKVLELVDEQFRLANIAVGTSELNRWLDEMRGRTEETVSSGRGFRLYYATQTGVRPPRFLIFCNNPGRMHFSTRRHIENRLRDRFGYGAVPIRIGFRGRKPREEQG